MLPAAGADERRYGHNNIPADCTDEKSGRRHEAFQRGRQRGPLPQLVAYQVGHRPGKGRCKRRADQAAVRCAGISYQRRKYRISQNSSHLILRRRRGTLHIRMGSRLQARIQANTPHYQRDRHTPADCPHGNSHPESTARHTEESGHGRCRGVQVVVQPRESLLRSTP